MNSANVNVANVLREHSFGGTKFGTRRDKRQHRPRREMPAMAQQNGIKMEWEHWCDKYPSMIQIRMTDGKWVSYVVHVRQPEYRGAAVEDE